MQYNCGHTGCDICGARTCGKHSTAFVKVGDFLICESCLRTAVRFAYEAAATFGGTFIDPSKPCGLKEKT